MQDSYSAVLKNVQMNGLHIPEKGMVMLQQCANSVMNAADALSSGSESSPPPKENTC